MKGTEVPNPQRSSACDCTCVLTRNRSLTRDSLILACHAHSVLFLPVQSSLTSFWHSLKGLCNLSFIAFLADFTLSDSIALMRFIAFSRKLHSAFHLPDWKTWSQRLHHGLPPYRYRSFTLWAYLCWRHSLLAVLLPMTRLCLSQVRTLSAWSRFIIRMRVFRGVKNGRLARSCTNRKRSSFATKHFQRKLLKIFDLHPLLRKLLLFVARIITFKVRCWVTDTHTHTDPSTVTLAAHACWGLTSGVNKCGLMELCMLSLRTTVDSIWAWIIYYLHGLETRYITRWN